MFEEERKEATDIIPIAIPSSSRGFSKRHVLMIIALLGFANVYALRVNLSVALVAMVNASYANGHEGRENERCSPASSSATKV